MIAVSGKLYRLYADLLRSMVHVWCTKHNKIPDTQFGFYPGRSMLHPLFILRHLKDAAQKLQRSSSRLYAAFINFKQAYVSISRSKMWDHLRKNQMPIHMLSILENLYIADEYTLLNGEMSTWYLIWIKCVKTGILVSAPWLCPISHAVNAVQVNGKQQGGEGAPLFHAKKWLDSRGFIPIQLQQRVFISIIQVFEDGQHVGELLVLTKVVPQFASGNGVICLFDI